jgi:hypothetical protein
MGDTGRGVRAGVLVAGSALTVVGVLGLAFDWASSTSVTGASATTTTTTGAAETPNAFFSRFTKALHDGDHAFLFDRMAPAVIERYGTAQCQAFAAQLVDPTASLRLQHVDGPATYTYTSDGRTTLVPNTFAFTVTGTAAGRSGTRTFHFQLVAGRFRLFTDCGNPVTP